MAEGDDEIWRAMVSCVSFVRVLRAANKKILLGFATNQHGQFRTGAQDSNWTTHGIKMF